MFKKISFFIFSLFNNINNTNTKNNSFINIQNTTNKYFDNYKSIPLKLEKEYIRKTDNYKDVIIKEYKYLRYRSLDEI